MHRISPSPSKTVMNIFLSTSKENAMHWKKQKKIEDIVSALRELTVPDKRSTYPRRETKMQGTSKAAKGEFLIRLWNCEREHSGNEVNPRQDDKGDSTTLSQLPSECSG